MSKHNYTFNECIATGKSGEYIIFNYISGLPNVAKVEDVSNVPDYQSVDIDFIAKFNDGSEQTIELKTDTYDSGNLFIELLSDIKDGRLGCMLITKSDYLFYFFIKTKELYIIKTKKFISWLIINMDKFEKREVKNKWGGKEYSSFGVLLPKRTLESEFKFYKKVIIE